MQEANSSGTPAAAGRESSLDSWKNLAAQLEAEASTLSEFFHELTLAQERTPRLLQLIADQVAKICGCGAAVYLLDKSGLELVPHGISSGFPPLVELSGDLVDESLAMTPALLSYLKLKPARLDDTVLGRAFREQKTQNLGEVSSWAEAAALFPAQRRVAAMFAPLSHGGKRLGLLVAASQLGGPFAEHTFLLFQRVAEQSAFALGSSLLLQEALEKRRMDGELRAASEVQRLLLPSAPPQIPGFRLAATNVPARIVSGDYYDFIPVDGSHSGVVIADVSGKGVSASLVMTTCRGLLRGIAPTMISPTAALSRLNRLIHEDIKEDMFVSIAYVMLDHAGKEVTLCRAGHDAPFLFRKATGEISRLEPPGVAIGIDAGEVFDRVTKDYTLTLDSGDALLLYTDGVNEAEDAEGNLLGLEQLGEVFRQSALQGPDAVLAAIQAAIANHVNGHPQSDDVTIIVIERL